MPGGHARDQLTQHYAHRVSTTGARILGSFGRLRRRNLLRRATDPNPGSLRKPTGAKTATAGPVKAGRQGARRVALTGPVTVTGDWTLEPALLAPGRRSLWRSIGWRVIGWRVRSPADHRTPLPDQQFRIFQPTAKRVISPGLAAQRPGQPGHAEPAVPSGRRELEWSQAPRIWATPTGVSDGCRSQNRARWPAATGSHSAVLRQRQAPLPLARGDGCLIRRKPWPRWWNLRDRSGVASDGPTYRDGSRVFYAPRSRTRMPVRARSATYRGAPRSGPTCLM